MTDFTSVDDTRFGIKSAQRKAQLPWTLVAKGATKTLRQICGVRPSGLRMLESTLKDVPMREGEEFPSLPCVAFSCSGICSVSQSFLDFAGESLEKVLGSDLRRAPLHWVLPMETNKWLNLEAWVPLEKLHKSAFAGASRLRQQNRVQANEEEEEATTSITTSVSSSQSMFLEERTPVTVSLLLSPGREGKVFWNLVHGFRTEIKKELLVIHVLMPIAVDVPSSFWTSQTGATTPTNGPIPELTPYVDGILQRLRSKLGKMQAQEAKQVKGVEDHFHTEEVPLPPSPARRRASDLGPMGQTQPNLPTELLRVAMTRRISEVSLCSSLPELFELWDAGAASAMRCRALEATELRCRELARALSDVWSGIHFVPRFGSAMALPYELYYFWEEVLANESQVLMSHWKYGKKGDRSHRRELFNIEPYMILDPDETDCPIAYMSQGLEDLFGYWRAWALGRNFRFLMLPDALPNRVFNGQEFSRIEDFCCNQGQKEQGSADAASHMMSLLRLYSVKSKQPIWCCLYLRHVWLQDPTVFESQFDFSAKHFILAVCLPLYTQMPALRDLLNNDMLETNMQLTARLRIMLMERTQNVEFCEKEAHAILNSLIPAWLLECGRGVPTCMVGQHFVPRLGLAPLKDFQGLWPHLVRLLFRLKNPPSEEMFQPTLHDQEQGLACWVVDVRSKDLPLVFISQALQRLSGFDADFALARNVQLFQPKKQRIDQAINNEESARLQEFSEQNRTHGDVMASLLLLERRNGQRFFVVQQTFYLKEPRSDRSYLLSVLHPIETPMPAVLKSHQITELSEDEMGMALDEWGMFLIQAREDPVGKPLMLSNVQKAREVYALSFAAFLRTCEDYVGDLFVPKIGLVEVHAFKGVLEPLVHQKLRADLRRVLADDRAEERLKEIIMTVVGGLMDGPALQEALRNFDIELLPYVVQEILDEVNQGEALDLSHFESALELILLREGFSRKEYDEFQMLYNMSNRDSSGEVQVAELKVMLHWLGFSASHMAPQLASQVERNGSGSLNFLEFMACMRLLRGIELDHVQELMQAAEHDESGKLDVKELPALLNSMGYETWDLQVIDETLEDSGLGLRCSRLGLGDVWRFLMEFRRKEGFCRDELKALSECFKHHDEDNSGELDNLESPLALRMLGFPVGYNEVQRWLLKVDVDESGALNLVEFRKLARMLQANDMNHFREVFDVYVLKVGNSGTLSRENAVTVLDSMGFCVGPAVFDSAHVNENQFLTVCYGLIKERRVECRRNGGWSAEELKWLRTEFDRYIPPGRAYVANKDLIRLLQDILPQMSRDPLFRPELRGILRQVEVESTGKLGFSKYLTFLQLCTSAKEKSVARRQQAAVEEVGFNQIELQELRDLFLDVAARPTCITFEEVWKLINSTTPLGHNLTVELQQIFNEQLMKRSDVHEPPEQALDFADFLRFMRRLMDMNFAKLAHDQ